MQGHAPIKPRPSGLSSPGTGTTSERHPHAEATGLRAKSPVKRTQPPPKWPLNHHTETGLGGDVGLLGGPRGGVDLLDEREL